MASPTEDKERFCVELSCLPSEIWHSCPDSPTRPWRKRRIEATAPLPASLPMPRKLLNGAPDGMPGPRAA